MKSDPPNKGACLEAVDGDLASKTACLEAVDGDLASQWPLREVFGGLGGRIFVIWVMLNGCLDRRGAGARGAFNRRTS